MVPLSRAAGGQGRDDAMKDRIRLIFCDMDGTLLDAAGELPPDFDEVIGEVLRRGALFAPASGRQYSALLRQLGRYVGDFLFIAENGTFAARRDEELFSSVMDRAEAMRVLETGLGVPGSFPVLCGKRIAWVGEEWRPYLHEMERFFTRNEVVSDLREIAAREPLVKIAFCDAARGDAEHTIYPALKTLDGPVHVALSSNYWVDVMNPGVHKGVAVRRVQALLGVAPAQCAAFGDYLNDVEMLRAVRYGFAMANAHPAARAAAAYRAEANTRYGVTKKLRELLSAGRI